MRPLLCGLAVKIKMKIAIIYDPVYPYVIGGGERRNWEIARRLINYKHDVYLVGMKYWNGQSRIVREGVKLVGICPAVQLYNKKGRRSYFEAMYFGVAVFFHLLKNRYDIIDCGNFPYFSCIFARLATFFRKTKFVITWHEIWGKKQWTDYAGRIGLIGWFIEKIVSRLSSSNIFVSEFMRERGIALLKIKRENTVVIPNGVEYERLSKVEVLNPVRSNPDAHRDASPTAGTSNGVKKEEQIVFAGRLIKHKRVALLIDAFNDICKEFSNYKLKIIGLGPEHANLKALVEHLGLGNKVIFTGFLEGNDLEKEIKKSKLLVLPSEREGMGIVIVESMALGTPVIALDAENSAAKCIIKNNNDGLLIKNKDEMVLSLRRLLTDKIFCESIIENGYKRAIGYDWDKSILPKITEYYDALSTK